MKKYNQMMRYAARRMRGARVHAELDLTAARNKAQTLGETIRADREKLAAYALAGNGTAEELTALRDAIAANVTTYNDLMGAIQASEDEQRTRVAAQFAARRKGGLSAEARGEFFRARLTGEAMSPMTVQALSLPITTGANPGNGLLPITVSDALIDDLYGDGGFLAEITVTQIPGLRLPKVTGTGAASTDAVAAGTAANEITVTADSINFGRFPGRDKIIVPSAMLRTSSAALNNYITGKLQDIHRDRMLKRMFAASPTGDYTHMSVYDTTVNVKKVEGATELDAILTALADLPAGVRQVAKVAMTPAKWYALVKTLSNGAATLFGKPDEAALGFKVVLCDYAATTLVGDLRTIHVNYDDPLSLESDRDIDLGTTKVVIGSDYDIQIEDTARLRLVNISA